MSQSLKRIALSCAIAVGVGAFGSSRLFAEDKPQQGQMPSPEEMMKLYEEAGKPAKEHELLKKFDGKWDAVVKEWTDPSAPPKESKGSSANQLMFDGRFVHSMFSGEMMGKKFQGVSVMGYDKAKQQYSSVWMDSMSTCIFVTYGSVKDGKLELAGEMDDPVMKTKCKMREVIEFPSDDKQIFSMYMTDPASGQEMKCLEITYTRAK